MPRRMREAGLGVLADHVEHSLRQEPSERADDLKHRCAAEAHYLMEQFSPKKITGTEGGAFRVIAAKPYEAATGGMKADMKRRCDSVLRNRRAGAPDRSV